MTPTGPDDPDTRPGGVRPASLAMVPRVLVALAGGCTVSGVLGFAWIATGHAAPATSWLLVPPALVLAATVASLALRRRVEER
jgi:hypothetical protein